MVHKTAASRNGGTRRGLSQEQTFEFNAHQRSTRKIKPFLPSPLALSLHVSSFIHTFFEVIVVSKAKGQKKTNQNMHNVEDFITLSYQSPEKIARNKQPEVQ